MLLEKNKTIVRGFIKAYNERKLNLIDDLVSPDYTDHNNNVKREGLKHLIAMGFNSFPDWYETIDDIIAEGDKVWVRLTYTGTHKGEFMGLPPTENKITSKAIDIRSHS